MGNGDLNGYGKRLGAAELKMEGLAVKTERNIQDIGTLFSGIDEMQKSINSILFKVALMILVPSLLLAVQLGWKLLNSVADK